ncbi:MAG: WD40 repeat domain-containing protein [Chloroflexi bacterium]|nr:WD40 repeat domain-containing protein [Chloroflexota bacterium]
MKIRASIPWFASMAFALSACGTPTSPAPAPGPEGTGHGLPAVVFPSPTSSPEPVPTATPYPEAPFLDIPNVILETEWGGSSVDWSPDGRTLAAGSQAVVALWQMPGGGFIRNLWGFDGYVWALAFSPDGKLLAAAGMDNPISVFYTYSWTKMAALEGHTNYATQLAWSGDSARLASMAYDDTIRLWDVASGECLLVITPEARPLGMALSPDGSLLALGLLDGTVSLLDASNGGTLRALQGHADRVNGVSFSPDGSLLASRSLDDMLTLWDTETWQPIHSLEFVPGPALALDWSPDGRFLAGATLSHTGVLEAASGRWLFKIRDSSVHGVAWSPDGLSLAGGDNTGARVWEVGPFLP